MSLLSPNRWKYRKQMLGRMGGISTSGTTVAFWQFGLKAMWNTFLTSRQIESARKVISRHIKKIGKMWIRVFPDVPITKKPLEVKMGAGKWNVSHYAARIKRWKIIFEIVGVDRITATEIFKQAWYKLPFPVKTVEKGEIN